MFLCSIGLFGPNAHENINVLPPPVNDTLLKPYAICPAHKNYDPKGEGTEYAKFVKSRTIQQLLSDVSQRLGYKFPLKLEQVLDIFGNTHAQISFHFFSLYDVLLEWNIVDFCFGRMKFFVKM